MNEVSTRYETTGRTRQKAETRRALVAATRRLLAAGVTPTVAQAAAEAGVSRAAAYRYFPTQRELLSATHPEIDRESLLPEPAPTDPRERLALVARDLLEQILRNETELRAMLRISLEGPRSSPQLLRQGRRVRWVADALEPLRAQFDDRTFTNVSNSIAATIGIEPFVWLTDMAGLDRRQAVVLMEWSALSLLDAALQGQLPRAT